MNSIIFIVLAAVILVIGAVAIYMKSFNVIICQESSGSFILAGQLRRGISNAVLPNPKGAHIFKVTINKGRLRLNHCSYNPDGSTWSLPPGKGKQKNIDIIGPGTFSYTIDIGESYGNTDKIELVNPSMLDDIEGRYCID